MQLLSYIAKRVVCLDWSQAARDAALAARREHSRNVEKTINKVLPSVGTGVVHDVKPLGQPSHASTLTISADDPKAAHDALRANGFDNEKWPAMESPLFVHPDGTRALVGDVLSGSSNVRPTTITFKAPHEGEFPGRDKYSFSRIGKRIELAWTDEARAAALEARRENPKERYERVSKFANMRSEIANADSKDVGRFTSHRVAAESHEIARKAQSDAGKAALGVGDYAAVRQHGVLADQHDLQAYNHRIAYSQGRLGPI